MPQFYHIAQRKNKGVSLILRSIKKETWEKKLNQKRKL